MTELKPKDSGPKTPKPIRDKYLAQIQGAPGWDETMQEWVGTTPDGNLLYFPHSWIVND